MQTTQSSMLKSLWAVQAFLNDHAAQLGGVVTTGAWQRLLSAIAALAAHATEQAGKAVVTRTSLITQETLSTALRQDHMAPIARIAKADLASTPELDAFRMPRGRPNAPKLVAAATGMAQAAVPYASTFVAAGLPADFVAQLNTASDALVAAVGDGSLSRGKRNEATAGLKRKLSDGRKVVNILDAFVTTALKDNPELLRNWNTTKRVRYTNRSAGSTTSTPVPVPTPKLVTPAA